MIKPVNDHINKNLKFILWEYASAFAENKSGSWWGHDTDLGDCALETSKAIEKLNNLIIEVKIKEHQKYLNYFPKGSSAFTARKRIIKRLKNLLPPPQSGEKE